MAAHSTFPGQMFHSCHLSYLMVLLCHSIRRSRILELFLTTRCPGINRLLRSVGRCLQRRGQLNVYAISCQLPPKLLLHNLYFFLSWTTLTLATRTSRWISSISLSVSKTLPSDLYSVCANTTMSQTFVNNWSGYQFVVAEILIFFLFSTQCSLTPEPHPILKSVFNFFLLPTTVIFVPLKPFAYTFPRTPLNSTINPSQFTLSISGTPCQFLSDDHNPYTHLRNWSRSTSSLRPNHIHFHIPSFDTLVLRRIFLNIYESMYVCSLFMYLCM